MARKYYFRELRAGGPDIYSSALYEDVEVTLRPGNYSLTGKADELVSPEEFYEAARGHINTVMDVIKPDGSLLRCLVSSILWKDEESHVLPN